METFDVVVVGAGWYGLAAAKTYLQLHPECDLIVLDSSSSVGGVWAAERLYPGLKSNNLLGTYEFSGFPMDPDTFGVRPGEHIPGRVMHLYLTRFAQRFGVYERIRFGTKVSSAVREENGGWVLTVTPSNDEAEFQMLARKLIVATGLTSEPHLPSFPGANVYRGLLFHSRDFKLHASTLSDSDNRPSSVTVIGGSKSAWDVAYAYATADPPIPVDLVIRASGRGPTWMSPAYVTPFKLWLEKLVHTRLLTLFSPCPWGDEDGYVRTRRFLHGTWLGRKIVDAFWAVLSHDVLSLVGYDRHPETAKLKPWTSAFWTGNGLGVLNFERDFLQLVRGGAVRVHVADVDRLSERAVRLANGEALEADVVCCATGWKAHPPIRFSGPGGSSAALGLPFSCAPDARIARHLTKLTTDADQEILARFPRLRHQPHFEYPGANRTPALEPPDGLEISFQPRLYRFLVPPSSLREGVRRDIAFPGMVYTISTALTAQAQALWIAAYFHGRLVPSRLPADETEAEKRALVWNRFGRWRYVAGYGGRVPDMVFDAVSYVDALLVDLGIGRRSEGLLGRMEPGCMKGLVGSWGFKVSREESD
ncbi:FAD/NAD(P)-binding domain-containing protein [Punctularia strigosozonata HHB-11173 SS5]|uniref:FAD/NAD(P)-binding domain-containing protein n=1 Tax=Punctularia strigosozonata (strain HHB-11173) TaxID=741275 RepID=UPI0004416441|nr:FAD/NAD(P)-binding domain-containing protein [Punctularia strigosozonata HHB-11173 SS5]EIN05808.1 FAD/NAD(P)-binding domain-containing protein [Punctularia strigosozonata HHB-11173 SS5]